MATDAHPLEQELAAVLLDLQPDMLAWIHEESLDASLIQRYRMAFDGIGINKLRVHSFTGGECIKHWKVLPDILDCFSQWGVSRSSVVLTTGGGALSDAVGMAASIWKRGVRVVHMPTTPLAAVDAAWGGKTAFNWQGVKNQVGTFHMPEHVHLDARWMKTLTLRQFRAGLAEAVKHAMLDAEAMTWLKRHETMEPLDKVTDWDGMTEWFDKMSNTKRVIVDVDVHEQGKRNLLNLGHTVAHALEAEVSQKGGALLHGEAVSMGLRFALFEARHGALAPIEAAEHLQNDAAWLEKWISENVPLPDMTWPAAHALWTWMCHDKKNLHDEVRDMAWRGVGQVIWPLAWEKKDFEATWEHFLRYSFGTPHASQQRFTTNS